jgi:hypothetical protein
MGDCVVFVLADIFSVLIVEASRFLKCWYLLISPDAYTRPNTVI